MAWLGLLAGVALAQTMSAQQVGSRDHCGRLDAGGAQEIPYNGIDDDCRPGSPDDDLDGDGRFRSLDCDDTNPRDDTLVVDSTWVYPADGALCRGASRVAVNGDLIISASATDVSGLSCVCAVSGDLRVSQTLQLESLQGLQSVRSVGGSLVVSNNKALVAVKDFRELEHVGGNVAIASNPALTNVEGMEQLNSIGGDLAVDDNASLESLSDLDGLESLGGDMRLSGNEALAAVDALEALEDFKGDLEVDGNQISKEEVVMAAEVLGRMTGIIPEDKPGKPRTPGELLKEQAAEDAAILSEYGSWATNSYVAGGGGWTYLIWVAFAGVAGLGLISALPMMYRLASTLFPEDTGPKETGLDESAFDHIRFDEQTEDPNRVLPRVLSGLSAAEQEAILANGILVSSELGEVLIEQGTDDPALAWLVRGELELFVDGIPVGQVQEDEVVGELGIFEYAQRELEVRGAMASQILIITREAYESLVLSGNRAGSLVEQVSIQSLARRAHEATSALVTRRLGQRRMVKPAGADRRQIRLRDFIQNLQPEPAGPTSEPGRVLMAVSGFSHFSHERFSALGGAMFVEEVEAGQVLFEQGEPGKSLHILVSGRCNLLFASASQTELSLVDDLHSGDVMGLPGLMSPNGNEASCVALSPCVVLSLDRTMVHTWLIEESAFARAFRVGLIRILGASNREAALTIAGTSGGGSQDGYTSRPRPIVGDDIH